MFKLLKIFTKNFRKNQDGSVAIETSIILPLVLIPLTLTTVDVGIAVNSGQSLTSASRAGTQYLLSGGENETELKSAITASFNGNLPVDSIVISANCACPNTNALSPTEPENPDEDPQIEPPYTLRLVTLATMDQCSRSCSDSSTERVLVNLSIDHDSKGLYKDYPIRKEVSVRVK